VVGPTGHLRKRPIIYKRASAPRPLRHRQESHGRCLLSRTNPPCRGANLDFSAQKPYDVLAIPRLTQPDLRTRPWSTKVTRNPRMTEYTEFRDPRLQSRVRTRYSGEMAALQALGFRQLACKLEARGPFSAVLYLPILPLMRRAEEVLVFPFPLRLAAAKVLFVHSGPPSIASCMGMGVKFYTNFSDQSLLISSTLQSHVALQDLDVQDCKLQIVWTPPCRTPEEAWLSPKRRTAEMEAEGKTIGRTKFVR
jgi:hypothetical protein